MQIPHETAITQVINRYGLAMDARRWDLFDSIFTPDVTIDYSGRLWSNAISFKNDFRRDHQRFDATQHAMMGHLIDVADWEATAFTYCSWRLICRGTEGGDFLEGCAWYDDALRMTEAGWRISRRRCRIVWAEGNPRVISADQLPTWHLLRDEANDGDVGYLRSIDDDAD